MSIDPKKWTSTLPISNTLANDEKYVLDGNRWVKTIPKKNLVSIRQKYSIIAIIFILGLFSVSTIKNATRELQKEISNLTTSVNKLKFNFHQSTVEHQFLTAPEKISLLAKKHLEHDFFAYKNSQIETFGSAKKIELSKLKIEDDSKNTKTKTEKIKDNVKLKTVKIVKKKKEELRKLQELYSKPEKLPDVIKSGIAKKIEKTKQEIRSLYTNSDKSINSSKISKWAGIQIVKVFLGIPIVPGR